MTSQQYGRSTIPGCCDIHSVFFLPRNTTCFQHDTWIQLFYIKEFDRAKLENQQDGITRDENKEPLNAQLMEEIIDCLFKIAGEDLTNYQKKYLKPTKSESARKLKDIFNNRRI
ncbi:MAG: hypothetical protein R6U40_08075 [Desulfobacterales bacterium]